MADTTQAAPTIRARVAAGAQWLDQHRPGWIDRIDLITLDVSDPECCVLGQLDDEWPVELTDWHTAEAHGFFVIRERRRLYTEVDAEYAELTSAWHEYVLDEARRVAAGVDPAPRWHADSHLPVARLPDYDEEPNHTAPAACCPCTGAVCDPGCPCTSGECPKTEAEVTDE